MLLFWQQGYTATSLAQLLDVMQIGRGSFYAAFSDKRSLFVEALSLFAQRTLALLDPVSAQPPLTTLRHFFSHTLLDVPAHRVKRGCMLVNTVLELSDVDDELSELATQKLAKMEAGFANCLRMAQQQGAISADQNPKQLAKVLMTLNQGLRVASRKPTSKKEIRTILNTTFNALHIAA